MAEIKESFINCKCGHRFHSPILFGDTETFDTATTSGNKARCPSCGVMIDCTKTSMSYVLADNSGGAVGDEFGINQK